MTVPAPAALSGVRVLDMGRVLSGPFCGMLLADLGAEVIKLEPPGSDLSRRFAPFVDGTSTYFRWVNRSKLGIEVDLRDPDGLDTVRALIDRCDIVVENFRPGVLARLGLPVAELNASNPGLIIVSISGFGQDGPLASLPSYDLVAQSMSGLMAATGPVGGGPTRSAVSIGDLVPGLYGALGALGALHERRITGHGQQVDVSMLDGLLSILESVAMRALHTDEPIVPLGNDHAVTIPYGTYQCSDGPVALVVGGDEPFALFARTLGASEWLADQRFATSAARVANRDALRERVERVLADHTVDSAVEMLRAAGIPAAPILGVREALTQEQAQARGMTPIQPDGFRTLGNPLRLTGSMAPGPAPGLGEHNDHIAGWLAEPPRSTGTAPSYPRVA
jgi:CoA:oxalate CoA-transferase